MQPPQLLSSTQNVPASSTPLRARGRQRSANAPSTATGLRPPTPRSVRSPLTGPADPPMGLGCVPRNQVAERGRMDSDAGASGLEFPPGSQPIVLGTPPAGASLQVEFVGPLGNLLVRRFQAGILDGNPALPRHGSPPLGDRHPVSTLTVVPALGSHRPVFSHVPNVGTTGNRRKVDSIVMI